MPTNKEGYMKNYYHTNENFKLKMLEKTLCECCNKSYSYINMYSHNKTKKHLKKYNLINING